METHVKILGIIYLALNALTLLALVVVAIILFGVGGFAALSQESGGQEAEVAVVFTVLGAILGCVCIVSALPGIAAGIGLLKFRPWARILAIILGALNLLNIPIGTALGVYTLVILLKPEADELFRAHRSA
ncbi:MAG: hypothetical protein JXR94_23015 [Candidatus Hydrogenedentes bacterium]|nr:hypothetical protein [Candidatus Hydrogenedentota bacterium]